MAGTLSKGTLFNPDVVKDLFNKVKGKSSLVALSKQTPVSFNGNDIFIFTMDNEVAIVGENEPKEHGGVSLEPVKVVPIKIEYGARVSDEFMYAAEERQLEILKEFNVGFSRKVSKGLDLMAMHGINPRTGEASAIIGDNCFVKKVDQIAAYNAATANENVEDAIAMLDAGDADVTGMAMSKVFRSDLAKIKGADGAKMFPELSWGSNPGTVNGLAVDVNSTVSYGESKEHAIIGDFENAFRWGYAKEIPMEVIPYGDPDNTGKDLKGHNQVYIRAEAYIAWAILDPDAFARISSAVAAG